MSQRRLRAVSPAENHRLKGGTVPMGCLPDGVYMLSERRPDGAAVIEIETVGFGGGGAPVGESRGLTRAPGSLTTNHRYVVIHGIDRSIPEGNKPIQVPTVLKRIKTADGKIEYAAVEISRINAVLPKKYKPLRPAIGILP